jgi:hypothetical protein
MLKVDQCSYIKINFQRLSSERRIRSISSLREIATRRKKKKPLTTRPRGHAMRKDSGKQAYAAQEKTNRIEKLSRR